MAGAGYKLFNTGDVLTAAQVNTYLMEQTVMVFADAAARTTALTGVVSEGMISYLKDTNAVEVYNGTAWVSSDDPNAIQNTIVDAKGDLITATASDVPARLAVGNNGDTLVADSSQSTGLRWTSPVGSLANPVINGGMDIWQRGTSSLAGATSSATGFTADRWQLYRGSFTSNSSGSRQATADTTNLPNIQYGLRIQRTAGDTSTQFFRLLTTLETSASIPFAGKTVTLSFYAKKGANFSASGSVLLVNVDYGTGTDQNYISGFTGVTNASSTNPTLTTTFTRYSASFSVSSSATQLAVHFGYTPTGTAGADDWFEITGVQIDVGTYTASSAPTFRRSGGTLQGELAACQRYYYRTGGLTAYQRFGAGAAYSTTGSYIKQYLPVTMRVAPTAIDYSANLGLDTYGGGIIGLSTLVLDQAGSQIVNMQATVASGLTQYRPYDLIANNNTSTFVGFSAEL